MHIHFLGICGTFMGSLALLARQLGHSVSGCDKNIYPPMSTQLAQAGIEVLQDYKATHIIHTKPDLIIIGNALRRGVEAVEYVLDNQLPYTSAPAFLADFVLKNKHVLAVSGTHGKTTTTTIVTHILEFAGHNPSYLIGGVPNGFEYSARLSDGPFFVVEADEYDSAFFDKRSKFIHYRPKTLIINNLEFDHADIFENLDAIKKQFHHLVRCVPSNGAIIRPNDDKNVSDVLAMGAWTPVMQALVHTNDASDAFYLKLLSDDGKNFCFMQNGKVLGSVSDFMGGIHNAQNALAATLAAMSVGVDVNTCIQALNSFLGVKRRMEFLGEFSGVQLFDDFAHHPTAIQTTLDAATHRFCGRIWALVDIASNTMKMGAHQHRLQQATTKADFVLWHVPNGGPDGDFSYTNIDDMIDFVCQNVQKGDVVIMMSNGAFAGLRHKLMDALAKNSI